MLHQQRGRSWWGRAFKRILWKAHTTWLFVALPALVAVDETATNIAANPDRLVGGKPAPPGCSINRNSDGAVVRPVYVVCIDMAARVCRVRYPCLPFQGCADGH